MQHTVEQAMPPPSATWADVLTGEYSGVSAVLAGGIALHAINITLSATMLPSVVSEIGGQDLYAWNATLATLASILSAAVTGNLLRRTGARLGFALAGLVFGLGSLMAALALTMPVLLVGRIIQGAGGGMLFTLCYSMIVVVYPERLWSRAMALLSGTWGITMLIGPAVGGVFAQLDMWRLGFGIMLPVAVLFIALTIGLLPRRSDRRKSPSPIALRQLMLLAGSVLMISLGSIAPSAIWALAAVLTSALMLAVLIRGEQGSATRLFPRGTATWRSPLSLSLMVMALLVFCINAEFFMPFFLQRLHGLSPLTAGYIAALVSIGWAASEVYSARFTGRPMYNVVVAGPVIMVVVCVVLGLATPLHGHVGAALSTVISFALIGLGVGIGLGWPHLNTFVLQFTDASERDMAASALSTVQMASVAFGTAIAGLVGNFTGFNDTNNIERIANSALWLFGCFTLVAIIAVWASRTLVAGQASKDA